MEKRPLNILIVSDAYYPYPSGITEYVHHLSNKLRDFGHRVDIVATSFNPIDDRRYDVIRVGRVFYLPANGSYATMPIGFDIPAKMKYIIQDGNYDIIHLNGPLFPNISFFALKYSNTFTVATFHSATENNRKYGAGIFKIVFGNIYKKLSAKIAVSEAAKRNYEPYIPGEYIIVPNGVDTDRFNKIGDKIQDIPENSILFLGRLDRRKGLHRLLKALPYVIKDIPDVKVIVAGSGPLEEYYKKMVKELNLLHHVEFRGFISSEDIPKYYRSCSLYTSPAEGGESFGIVLIEAMASGVPVVASNIQGYNEVIQTDKNGVLVDTKNPEEYGYALSYVLKDKGLREKLIKNGIEVVRKKYSWDVVAKKIESLYLSIL